MVREWPKSTASKREVRRAGNVLRDPQATPEARANATAVAKAWRSAHGYPMNTWQTRVRRYVKDIPGALVAQRLKRISSIEKKLIRFPHSQLDGMQDLGGVRVVLPSVADVRRVEKMLINRPGTHVLKTHNDYLAEPKEDGYRGIHLVHAYRTTPSTSWETYKAEIQLRTTLQHFWATGLETVDLFTAQQLKSGSGDDWWREFFAIMSSEIATIEKLPIVPGTPATPEERRARLIALDGAHGIITQLRGFQHVANTTIKGTAEGKYVLLDLDLDDLVLETTGFNDKDVASDAYAVLETEARDNEQRAVVLVSVDDVALLPQAYPNYFINMEIFINLSEHSMAEPWDEI